MHRGIGKAILELRRRMEWSQEELAQEIHRYREGGDHMPAPHDETISRWENGRNFPTAHHRTALAKIAAARQDRVAKEDLLHMALGDLHVVLTALPEAWRLVTALRRLGIDGE